MDRGPHRQLLFLLVPLVPSLRIEKTTTTKQQITKNKQKNPWQRNRTIFYYHLSLQH